MTWGVNNECNDEVTIVGLAGVRTEADLPPLGAAGTPKRRDDATPVIWSRADKQTHITIGS